MALPSLLLVPEVHVSKWLAEDAHPPLRMFLEMFLKTPPSVRSLWFSRSYWPLPVSLSVNCTDFDVTITAFSCP